MKQAYAELDRANGTGAVTGFAIFDKHRKLVEANEEFFLSAQVGTAGQPGDTIHAVVKQVVGRLAEFDGAAVNRTAAFVKSVISQWSAGTAKPIEARTVCGSWKLLSCHPQPGGGLTLFSVDITSVKLAQLQLHENEEIFRCITESHPLPVWMADKETGEILYESIEASKILGRDWDPDKPQYILDHYVDLQDRQEVKDELERAGVLRDHLVRLKRSDGSRFWISANVRSGRFRGRDALIAGVVDVTERKQREDQIRFMLEGHPLPVSMNELDTGRLIVRSPALDRLFGFDPDTGAQLNASDFYVNLHDREGLLQSLRKNGRIDDVEVLWKRCDGSRFWAKVSSRLVEFDGKQVVLSGVLDVTEQKHRVQELARARELLADAIESISEGFALYDEEGRLVICNSSYAQINDAAGDIIKPGMRWHELIRVSAYRGEYPEAVGREEEWIEEQFQMGMSHSMNTELQHADGRWSHISSHPTKLGGFVVTRSNITGRKQIEESRREADAIVRQVVDACPAALEMRKISDGTFLYRSPAAIQLLGERRDLAATYVNTQDQIDLHRHLQAQQEVLDRRMQLKNAAGEPFWASVSARYIEFRGDLVIVSTIQDLTERVRAEQGLERVTELLSDAIESLAEGFALFDSDRRLVMCNSRYRTMNKPTADLLKPGMRWEDFLRAGVARGQFLDGQEHPEKWIKGRLKGVKGYNRAHEFQQSNGRWYSALSNPTREGGFVITRMDITKRVEMEKAQRAADALVKEVLEASPVMILMNELESGEVIYRSPATNALFGEPDSVLSFYADPADRDIYLAKLKKHGVVDDFRYQALRPDGDVFWASVSGRLIDYQGRKVIVSSTRDLTEQLKIEGELARQREIVHQSEKLSALGELLAGVAHELNNPLSVMVGQALLLSETAKEAGVKARAEKIGSAADRCARIVKTFLAMARQQPARTENTNINEVLESALEVVGYGLRSSDIDVSLALMRDLPAIWGDPDQLSQVFSNLLINAEHALSDHEGRRKVKIATRFDARKNMVVVKVADSGPGIPENIRSRIFEPFFTTKQVDQGTGIGLALCHRIIETHGGSIRVESKPGHGAAFFISLPTSTSADSSEDTDTQLHNGTGLSNILVVDDEPAVAELLAEILTKDGHTVTVVSDGGAALREIARQDFSVVLSDLNMPGLGGADLFGKLREFQPELAERVAFVTGDTMSRKARQFLQDAGRPYLEKPIRPTELRQIVADLAMAD